VYTREEICFPFSAGKRETGGLAPIFSGSILRSPENPDCRIFVLRL
jgi:hypothetical protein